MTDWAKVEQVRRMADMVVSRSFRTKVENTISVLCILLGTGLAIFAFALNSPDGSEGVLLIVLLVAINTAPFVLGSVLQKRRKAALLNLVMPYDQAGTRRLDQDAYMFLAAECRAIEEADFRKELAKSVNRIR